MALLLHLIIVKELQAAPQDSAGCPRIKNHNIETGSGEFEQQRTEGCMSKADVYRVACLTKSYWPADTSEPLINISIGNALRQVAAEVPDRLALVEGVSDPTKRRRWTYAQLLSIAERVASALLGKFEPGEHIAIWAPNCVEWVLLQYGCAIAGMTLVTVSPAYQSREVEYLLRQSESAGLFLMEEYRGHHMHATIEKLRGSLPNLREIITISELEDFINTDSKSVTFPKVDPKDPCLVMYTSGTTGDPKGALLYHMALLNSISFMAERAGLEAGGVYINTMPMFHIGGAGFAVLGSLVRRATHVLVARFDPLLFLELIQREQGTYGLLVPTMIEAILNFPDLKKYNLSTLKTIQSGASKVEAPLVRRVKAELGCEISIVFGQIESHGGMTQTHLSDLPEDQTNTIGQPYPQCELKIADPLSGKVLPLGMEGEICCRGYQTMLGYYKMPEETAKVLKRDGWLHSGDLGSMDERGFVKITGRLKDMIIRGGENIYPAEIEKLLHEHPKIAQATVVGVPDDYWGEQIGGIVMPKSLQERPTVEELDEYCRTHLSSFKRPRFWYFVSEFPTTEAGILRKFILRDLIVKGEMRPEKE